MSKDSSVALARFVDSAIELSLDEFAAQFGRIYLIRAAADGMLMPMPEVDLGNSARSTFRLPDRKKILGDRLGRLSEIFVYTARRPDSRRITVGRDPDSDICVDDVSVSAKHCMLELDDAGIVRVTDLGSSNGTKIGEDRIEGCAPIEFGKSLTLGAVSLLLLPVSQFTDLVVTMAGPG